MTIWHSTSCALVFATLLAGQSPTQPAASPASRPRPKASEQLYSAADIKNGAQKFSAQCGFCHGRDASGGEGGPDLTRSTLIFEDNRGDKLSPFLKTGRPREGMPAFNLNAKDFGAILAYIHNQQTKFAALGGGRQAVDGTDLTTGNAEDGKRYFEGTGKCGTCHSVTGDLAGVGGRFEGLALLRRMLYPSGRPAPKPATAVLTLSSGETVTGDVESEDEFDIVILNTAGTRQTYEKSAVKYKINDPMSAHFDQLGKYSDVDMHNVYAYLATLK